MNKSRALLTFIESIKNKNNAYIIESIEKAINIIFESVDESHLIEYQREKLEKMLERVPDFDPMEELLDAMDEEGIIEFGVTEENKFDKLALYNAAENAIPAPTKGRFGWTGPNSFEFGGYTWYVWYHSDDGSVGGFSLFDFI